MKEKYSGRRRVKCQKCKTVLKVDSRDIHFKLENKKLKSMIQCPECKNFIRM